MAEIVTSAASKVVEYLVAPVRCQCGYVVFTDSYVGQLKDELEKLDNARQRVQHSVDEALKDMKLIEADVEKWAKDVESVINKAHDVLENDGRAKKTCFCGWLPNPKERYCLGRDAWKTAQTIQALIPLGKFERVYYESAPPGLVGGTPDMNLLACDGGDTVQELIAQGQFKKVDFENPPPGLVGGAPDMNLSAGDGGDTITDSRASIFQGIMKALDDEKLKVIGVYGPGGVGKTWLLEKVEKEIRKERGPFHAIAKSNVSQTPDLKKIQDDIAYAFGLNLKDEPSEVGRRDRLLRKIQSDPTKKVLVILDDLWKELDLRAVGIPSEDESKGCQVLLTSRYKDVLQQKMCASPVFHLTGLKDDQAFQLFEKTVGDRLKDDEELKAIAHQVVKKLAGLPLLIISVGSTLKDSDVYAWRNALVKIDEPNVETIVKLSYDHLKNEDAKFLFLLCSLIGGTIQVETLLVLGMGLGLFEGFKRTIQDSKDRLNTMLDELRSACLLLDSGNDRDNVTIHDLYSEVATSTPFRGQNYLMMNGNYGSWPKEKLKKCWAICLADVGKDRLAELMLCQFPDLKILMLSQQGYRQWILDHQDEVEDCSQHEVEDCSRLLDFTDMKELHVLCLHSMHITSLPPSVKVLGNLQSLYLANCHVGDVAILGKLKALQILSFVGSVLSRLPKEIGDLTNLRSLNLSNCNRLQTIEPGALKGLINLEELHMRGSLDRWIGNDEIPSELWSARLAELKSLKKMASLEISILDPTILLEDDYQSFKNLTRFWINIGNFHSGESKGLRTLMLNLEGCNSILSKEWVQKALQKTQYLNLNGLKEFKKNTNELCIHGFPQLKHLNILNSPSIKYIANSSNDLILIAFMTLESLFLKNLINMEKICHGPIALKCFSKLKVMSVHNCNQSKYLWCLSEIQRLVQLEEIEVKFCDSMQAIVIDDARKDKVTTNGIVELPNLRCLELTGLPNITSFCGGAEITSEGALIQVSLPSLQVLTLSKVGSLTLGNCSKLLNVFSSTIIERLHNLKTITIYDCDSLKSLFDCGSLDANTEQKTILLSKLEGVTIDGARRLRHLVKNDSPMVLGFPSLKYVLVRNCSDMKYLFPAATMLEKLEGMHISQCEQMKEVVSKEGGGRSNADMMSFPSLRDLSILHCPGFGAFFPSPTSVKRQLGKMAEENDEFSQPLFNEMVTFPNLRSLKIEGLRCKELWNNQIPTDSFRKLEYLELNDCDNLQCLALFHMWKRLQCCLEILKVKSCRSMEIICEGDETDTEKGKLRKLLLHDLKNLRHIWQSDGFPNVPFPNLRYVDVVGCPRLEILFITFTVKFLGQIEELVVESCEDMELIAGHEKWEEAIGATIAFSNLIKLRLFKLPKFRGFLPERYSLKFPYSEDFPSLRVLSIVSCGTEGDQGIVDWTIHRGGLLIRRLMGLEAPPPPLPSVHEQRQSSLHCWP